MIDKALPTLAFPLVTPVLALSWLGIITSPLLLHCATGGIYGGAGARQQGPALCVCIVLHLAHNFGMASALDSGLTPYVALGVLLVGIAEFLAVLAWKSWLAERDWERCRIERLAEQPPIV